MVATYIALVAMPYAATSATPIRATTPTRASAPPMRTTKSAEMGSPVRTVRRRSADRARGEGPAARSTVLRRSITRPHARAAPRPATVAMAAPRTPRPHPRMSSGSRTRISPLESSARRIGVRVSPVPLRMPSTTLVAKKTAVPGSATEK
ncbi:hypothetical protein ADK54_23850 [Streptomyces sp. WM6378]|nr:hypothetical protein ADK54_23850 [Streptomyces sp. WM6378]